LTYLVVTIRLDWDRGLTRSVPVYLTLAINYKKIDVSYFHHHPQIYARLPFSSKYLNMNIIFQVLSSSQLLSGARKRTRHH
jgi:hypothetical protein